VRQLAGPVGLHEACRARHWPLVRSLWVLTAWFALLAAAFGSTFALVAACVTGWVAVAGLVFAAHEHQEPQCRR
jgi:hypothetical protein